MLLISPRHPEFKSPAGRNGLKLTRHAEKVEMSRPYKLDTQNVGTVCPKPTQTKKSVYEWEMILENHHQELFFLQVVPGLIKDSCIQNCPSTSPKKQNGTNGMKKHWKKQVVPFPSSHRRPYGESRVGRSAAAAACRGLPL